MKSSRACKNPELWPQNLSDYYEDGKELVVFNGVHDLIVKIREYSRDEEARVRIAKAGHARTLAEHTYEHRFNEIFARIGLDSGHDSGD